MDMRATRPPPAAPEAAWPQERFLDPKRPIVTKTDLEGRITYANPAFVAISGFSREELIGAHHNIVRHPDMPKAAFADLWRTVQAGHPWRGLVKNRAKNGDFYWVDAYVTPLTENGRAIGYMSVRNAPSTADREAAAVLYAAVAKGKQHLPPTPLESGMPLGWLSGGGLALITLLGAGSAFSSGFVSFSLLALQLVAAVGLWLLLRASVSSPLQAALQLFRQVAEGDLKAEITARGCRELSALLTSVRSMQVSLRALIGDVVSSAGDTAREAGMLHSNARRLQQGSQEQADQISSSAAAMQELAVSVSEIAGTTDSSAREAGEALRVTEDGQRNMNHAADTTHKVADAVADNERMLDALSESVEKIGAVAASISQIAKRTNLLALNAAIEAARAGEQGRGFAVVAGEVTELAGQTQQSTESIASLVAEISERRADVIASMRSLREGVADSVGTIRTVVSELEVISRANTAVAGNALEVQHMLRQQEQASTEVANIMERMSSLTDDNLDAVGRVEQAAGALETTSRELQLLVGHFERRM